MHELAIIQGVLDIVETEAGKGSARAASRSKLRIGEFTGVVPEALEFSFESAKYGTVSEGASLEIEMVPLRKRCRECDTEKLGGGIDFLCEKCGAGMEILSGREMQVEFIDFD